MVPWHDRPTGDAWGCPMAWHRGHPLPARHLLERRRSADGGATTPVRIAVADRSACIPHLRWPGRSACALVPAALSPSRSRPAVHHGAVPGLLDDGNIAQRALVLSGARVLRDRVRLDVCLVHELGVGHLRRTIGSHLAIMLIATTVTFGLSVAQKAQCMTRQWVEDKTGVRFLCDTDIPHLYAWEQLAGSRL